MRIANLSVALFGLSLGIIAVLMPYAHCIANVLDQQTQTTQAESFSADLTPQDKAFLTQAVRANLAEVEMGRLAEQRSQNPAVRQFADRMVRDHSSATIELREIASANGVALPVTIDAADDAAEQHLSSLSGEQFDHAYMSEMIKDLSRDVDQFLQATNSALSPEVKNFAVKMLPTVQSNLDHARQIESQALYPQ